MRLVLFSLKYPGLDIYISSLAKCFLLLFYVSAIDLVYPIIRRNFDQVLGFIKFNISAYSRLLRYHFRRCLPIMSVDNLLDQTAVLSQRTCWNHHNGYLFISKTFYYFSLVVIMIIGKVHKTISIALKSSITTNKCYRSSTPMSSVKL